MTDIIIGTARATRSMYRRPKMTRGWSIAYALVVWPLLTVVAALLWYGAIAIVFAFWALLILVFPFRLLIGR